MAASPSASATPTTASPSASATPTAAGPSSTATPPPAATDSVIDSATDTAPDIAAESANAIATAKTAPAASRTLPPDIVHHAALDARMVQAVSRIRLLSMVSWPASVQKQFLDNLANGRRSLPQVEYPKHDFSQTRAELDAIIEEADNGHPLGQYLIGSARSWEIAAELLESLGTREVATHSIRLFGRPDEPLPGNGPSTTDAAQHFIDIADELDQELLSPAESVEISATALQLQLQSVLDDFFNERVIDVVLDPELIAKAAAGATRIRLRHGAAFSDYDRHQLVQHEAFVHSLTALNGREQPYFPSLSLSSPRTTATQEGLAVFAEQITGSIDIERMKRISLRIEAVDMALKGADFLQVFDYFRAAGQSDVDSATSAQRVFRGVPVTGGAAFTKDTVYLRGLISVHTFFRWALRQRKLLLCRRLFAGKMTLGDVQRLEPMFEAGVIVPPRWLPQWVVRANGLAGMLAFSLFANRIRLDAVAKQDDFLDI